MNSLPQIIDTTQLPEGAIRHTLESGEAMKLLVCQDNRVYRIAVLYQQSLIRYLQAKHCLYE